MKFPFSWLWNGPDNCVGRRKNVSSLHVRQETKNCMINYFFIIFHFLQYSESFYGEKISNLGAIILIGNQWQSNFLNELTSTVFNIPVE